MYEWKPRDVIGDIAQLGERLPCTQEVSGSIPLISTNIVIVKFIEVYFFIILFNGIKYCVVLVKMNLTMMMVSKLTYIVLSVL